MAQTQYNRGYLLALAAATMLSFKSILVKKALQYGVTPHMLILMRMAISLPIFFVIMLAMKRTLTLPSTSRQWIAVIAMGVIGISVAMYSSFLSIAYIGASMSTVITFTYPTITVLMDSVYRKKNPGLQVIGSSLLTFLGLYLVIQSRNNELYENWALGAGLALLSAITFAFYNILFGETVKKLDPMSLSTLVAVVSLATFTMVGINEPIPHEPMVWVYAVLLGVTSGTIPYLATSFALRDIGASRASMIATVGPALTVFWAQLMLQETFTMPQYFGLALIIGGILFRYMSRK